jgi:hypothetical protein
MSGLSNRSIDTNKYAESNCEKEGGQFGSNGEGLEGLESPVSEVSGDSRRPSKMGRRTSVDLEEKIDLSRGASRSSMTSIKDIFVPSMEEKVAIASEDHSNSNTQALVPPLLPLSGIRNNKSSDSLKSLGVDSTVDFAGAQTSSLDTTNPSVSVGTKGPGSDLTSPQPLSIPGSTAHSAVSSALTGTGWVQGPGHEVTLPVAAGEKNSIYASSLTGGTIVGGIVDPEKPGSSRNELTFQPHELAQLESTLASPLTMSKPTTARAASDSEPSVHGPLGAITTDTTQKVSVPVTTGDWALDSSAVALALGNISGAGGKEGAVAVSDESRVEGGGEKSNGTVAPPQASAVGGAIMPTSLSTIPSIVKKKKTWTNGKKDDDDAVSVASTEYGSEIFADISMSRQAALEDSDYEGEDTTESAAGALMMLAKGGDAAQTADVNVIDSDVTTTINSGTHTSGEVSVLPSMAHATPSLPQGAAQTARTALTTQTQTVSALPNKPSAQVLDTLESLSLSENGSFSSGMKSLSAASTLPSDMAQTPKGPVSRILLVFTVLSLSDFFRPLSLSLPTAHHCQVHAPLSPYS